MGCNLDSIATEKGHWTSINYNQMDYINQCSWIGHYNSCCHTYYKLELEAFSASILQRLVIMNANCFDCLELFDVISFHTNNNCPIRLSRPLMEYDSDLLAAVVAAFSAAMHSHTFGHLMENLNSDIFIAEHVTVIQGNLHSFHFLVFLSSVTDSVMAPQLSF